MTDLGPIKDEELKYQRICRWVLGEIDRGELQEGQRLPSEVQLVRRFHVSRPTVIRALLELKQKGIVERRAGSGTYVAKNKSDESYVFGLLIPDLGRHEIFVPICQSIADGRRTKPYELLWGQTLRRHSEEERVLDLCDQYIARKVSGVFFVPFEFPQGTDTMNRRIMDCFDRAGIPIVLLDRDICAYPRRSRYDLVGIDNARAGYTITEHLLKLGCRRIVFFARPTSATSVEARARGYRDALMSHGITPSAEWVRQEDGNDPSLVRQILDELKPEAFVCVNDITAGQLMRTLTGLGLRIPDDIRIVGIDDVKFASLLHVPLTTLHQPCQDIGTAALMAMFTRIADPNMPGRHIMLDFKLIVRQSCGSHLKGWAPREVSRQEDLLQTA